MRCPLVLTAFVASLACGSNGDDGASRSCEGYCAMPGATCTISPPPGSDAMTVSCVCSEARAWNCGGTGTGGSTATGGTSSGDCAGSCPSPGATCTIDPPPGSLAPSVLCQCTDALEWCCGDAACFGSTGGGGGVGGEGGSGAVGSGSCVQDCTGQGLACCGGRCVNTQNDIANCGECGNACAGPNPYCGFGTCGAPPCSGPACSAGTCCGSQCCASGQLCCDVNVGPSVTQCTDPVNGTCPVGCPLCVCASAETLVATPRGDVPIGSLEPGDVVYSIDRAAIVSVPILEINRVPAPNHVMIHAQLENGAVVQMSPRHPTADGRRFGDLRAGDRLGDLAVESVRVIGYEHPFTYDVLPASETGAYFVGGAPVGSTLKR